MDLVKRFLLPSLCFFVITTILAHLVIKRSYSVDTNYCQYVQGWLFSHGVLHGDARYFQGHSVHTNCMVNPFRTGYASKYPPGYSALIAAALPLSADNLINPLCGALTLLFTLLIVKRAYGDARTCFWITVLSFASIYFLHMSAESWNHPSALLACTLIVWATFRERPRILSSCVVVLFALIFCTMTRPFSSFAMSTFLVIVVGYRRLREPDARYWNNRIAATALIGTALGVCALGCYHQALTGSFFQSGYEALHGAPHNPGFHIDPYGRNFTAWAALKDLLTRWKSMDQWLFMWPVPSLTLLALAVLSFKRWRPFDGVCVLWIALQSFIYCSMWSAGQVQFGPRFLYEALPAILILSARGMVNIEEYLGGGARVRMLLLAAVVLLSTIGFYRYLELAARLY